MNEIVSSFLQDHGVSLIEEGSSERALNQIEVIEFLKLLTNLDIKVLGFEIWRLKNNGRYKIDSLAGWASSTDSSATESNYQVENIIKLEIKKKNVFFTIQF